MLVKNEGHVYDENALIESIEYPGPEHLGTELSTLHPQPVKLRVTHQLLFGELEVEKSVPDDGQTREYDVVKLVNPWLVESLSGEYAPKPKVELNDDVQHVFVKVITDQVGVPSITFPTVNE